MTRLLVLGAAPLPSEPMRRQYAANLRTWHFVRPLLDEGHEVRLVACRLPNTYPEDHEPETRRVDDSFAGRLEYLSLAPERFEDRARLQALHDEFAPDAVIGVNTHPASRAAELSTEAPVWCDLNGWIMAEAQTKCHLYDDDVYLSHFWKMEKSVLDRADVISTVSRAQAFATVGELAAHGRLSRRTFGYDFTHAIPNAISEVDYVHHRQVARGVVVPEDAFLVLWVGGYNTWTDVDLLFDGLVGAMERVPAMHFVSTGGAIEGHDDLSFRRFRERIAASPLADRFHFVGWVPTEDVPCYYYEANVGLNVDAYNYETIFGARNRLNDMAKVGLPVLTTLGTEISHDLAERDLALVVPTGDAGAFAEKLVWGAEHGDELRAMGESAKEFVHDAYSYERTTEALREWARAPRRAPDFGERIVFEDVDFYRAEPAAEEASPEPDPQPEPEAQPEPQPESGPSDAERLAALRRSPFRPGWLVYRALRKLFRRS